MTTGLLLTVPSQLEAARRLIGRQRATIKRRERCMFEKGERERERERRREAEGSFSLGGRERNEKYKKVFLYLLFLLRGGESKRRKKQRWFVVSVC